MALYDKASLVLIPSGTKEGVIFSQKPTNGDGDFTFSRASAGTRVNSDGLIEKERGNLLLQSNTFSTGWANNNSTETGGQSGYDGSNDAWLLNIIGGTASQRIEQNQSTSGVQTFSVYAKAGTLNWMYIRIDGSGGLHTAYFDLQNGAVGTTALLIDSNIEAAGNGFYRCSLTFSDTITIARIYLATADGNTTQSSGNIYIQDSQLESGLVATDYIETTTAAVYEGITDNIPRLDYTDASCPSLLLEPQRTNLVPYSDYFGGSSYTNLNLNIETNNSISVEGVLNSTKITPTTSNVFHDLRSSANLSINSGQNTCSIFAKSDGYDFFELGVSSNSSFSKFATAVINLSNGTNANTGVNSTWTITNIDIESFENNWYRLILTFNVDANTSSGMVFMSSLPTSSRGVVFLGDGTSGTQIYGLQLEESSYPTSYIPTYGASVTKLQDECSVTGVSDLIGQPNGSIFLDFVYDNNTSNTRIFSVTGANWFTNGSIRLEKVSNLFRWNWLKAGVGGANLNSTTTMVKGTRYKMAITYTDSVCSLFINGTKEDTSACDTPTNLSGIYLNELGGGYSDGWEFQRNIFNQVLMFNTTLTDQEAIDLTTI